MKPHFTIHSIQFHPGISMAGLRRPAIRLKHHLIGRDVPLPEFVEGVRNEPAAFVAGTLPHIKVKLKKLPEFVSGGTYIIGAKGNLGGVRREIVQPVFNSSGVSDAIDFELGSPLPGVVGKSYVRLDWYARQGIASAISVSVGSTSHSIYLVLAKPKPPWGLWWETPWVAALEIACGWAAGAATLDGAATRITERYHNCGRVSYDTVNGATMYQCESYGGFMLSEMIERLNGGYGLGEKVNCVDCANTVLTLANLLGCRLWPARMGTTFKTNPIMLIGCGTWGPQRFNYHEVAWKGNCTENDRLFDGSLQVDVFDDPTGGWHYPLLPTNMLFGDCDTLNYRLRLCPDDFGGCLACIPLGAEQHRRLY